MHQYHEREGKEDRKPGGNTRVKEIRKVWANGGGRIGQRKLEETFVTVSATLDDRNSLRRSGMHVLRRLIPCKMSQFLQELGIP